MLTSLILWINFAFSIVINENEKMWSEFNFKRTSGSSYSSIYWLDLKKTDNNFSTDYETMLFYLKNTKIFPSEINIWTKVNKKEVERFLVELKNIINSRKEKLDNFEIFMSIDNFTDKNINTISEIKNVKSHIGVIGYSDSIQNRYKKIKISNKNFEKLNKNIAETIEFDSPNEHFSENWICSDFYKNFEWKTEKISCWWGF